MCFSAPVSFVTSGVLALTGVAAMRKAGKTPSRWYAAVPLLFSAQQFIEGLQWLAEKPSLCSTSLGYAFLVFAFLLWPFYFPFAALKLETDPARRRLLRGMTWFGLVGSLSLLAVLLVQPLTVAVTGNSIEYQIVVPFDMLGIFLYVVATCGSGLLSTHPGIRLFAGSVFLSFMVSILFYEITFTSVWCFFAAALSVLIYLDVCRPTRGKKN